MRVLGLRATVVIKTQCTIQRFPVRGAARVAEFSQPGLMARARFHPGGSGGVAAQAGWDSGSRRAVGGCRGGVWGGRHPSLPALGPASPGGLQLEQVAAPALEVGDPRE